MQERQTKQKQIIYDALQRLNHPTATEVYAWVHDMHPTVSRATVFRVLGGFAASGQALELRFAGNEVRYDYNTHAHYHARCVGCGKVADVEAPFIGDAQALKAQACDDFTIDGCVVEFFGRCRDCQVSERV
ncbi:MAG: transcriptional repressor [Clostridia bacterium]|nr:transcriptional repressor [Clostridia bacterium]